MYDNTIKIYELEDIKNKILEMSSTVVNRDIYLHIKLIKEDYNCKHCLSDSVKVNDYVKTIITHSISSTRKVYINYSKRRFKCKLCNKTFYEDNPFTDRKFRTSKLTIMNILEYLKDPNHSFTSAARLYNVSVTTVINIFDSYVIPKRKKLPRVLCIDEVHIKSYTKYPYACVLLDFETGDIIDVLRTRHKTYLNSYFEGFSIKELDNVEYAVTDLWAPYRDVIRKQMPKAKIIADAFHVITNISRILDKKRIQVMNYYLKYNTENLNYYNDFGYLLKRYSVLIRTNREKIISKSIRIPKYKIKVHSYDLLKHLLSSNDELKEIYNLKHIYQDFNLDSNTENAKDNLLDLINNFRNHEIYEIREYGKLLYRWQEEIINSFIEHNGRRYTNAILESKNRHIKTIIRNSFGVTNFHRFKARVMYSLNKDVPLNLTDK